MTQHPLLRGQSFYFLIVLMQIGFEGFRALKQPRDRAPKKLMAPAVVSMTEVQLVNGHFSRPGRASLVSRRTVPHVGNRTADERERQRSLLD